MSILWKFDNASWTCSLYWINKKASDSEKKYYRFIKYFAKQSTLLIFSQLSSFKVKFIKLMVSVLDGSSLNSARV